MAGCPTGPAFDVVETSGFYAQMAGLLAGFAFSAIIFLLRPRRANDRLDGVILTLLVAFVALVLSTLTYSVLAGEKNAYGRAAVEEVINGLPFALAIMMLFHGVSQLIATGSGVDGTAVRTSRLLTAGITPVLAMFYIVTGAIDTEHARIATRRATEPGYCGDLEPVMTFGILLLVLLAVLLASAWVLRPRQTLRVWVVSRQSLVPLTVMWVSVGSTLLVGLVTLQEPNFLLSESILIVFLITTWLLLAALAVLILWGQPLSPRADVLPADSRTVADV